jgi:hypothetical protein
MFVDDSFTSLFVVFDSFSIILFFIFFNPFGKTKTMACGMWSVMDMDKMKERCVSFEVLDLIGLVVI